MLHSRMLRYLDEVARCRSIRKASERLNVASSAVNRQIIALEQEIGEPIFERMPQTLRLTATGEILIEHVRATLKEYARVNDRLTALKGVQRGRVAISTTLGLAGGPFAKIVADFTQRYPGVEVQVRALFADAIPNSVMNGEMDLGLGFNFKPHKSLRTLMTFDVPLGAVVAPDHPLASRSNVRFSDIHQHPLVLAEPGMSLRSLVDAGFNRVSITPRAATETNSVEMMKQMLKHSPGAVTFLNPLDISEERARGELVFVSLADQTLKGQPMTMIARAKGALDPIGNRFVEHLRTQLSGLVDDAA